MHARRPIWQFSLRSLLIVMLLVAAFCGGWASRQGEVNRAREEAARAQSVAAFERAARTLAEYQRLNGKTQTITGFPETEHDAPNLPPATASPAASQPPHSD